MSEIPFSKRFMAKLKKSSLFSPGKNIVYGKGNFDHPEFLILGEAPGKEENKVGKPFVGKAGKILDGWIEKAGIKDKVYISNVVPLIPLDSSGEIRKPTELELKEYRFFFKEIILQVKPTFIITLGDSATWAIIHKPVRLLLGKGEWLFEEKLTAIYHPIYYAHRGIISKGAEDFIKAVKFLRRAQHKHSLVKVNTDSGLLSEIRHRVKPALKVFGMLWDGKKISRKSYDIAIKDLCKILDRIEYTIGEEEVKCPHCGTDVPCSIFFDDEAECPKCEKMFKK
jgi:uracil-DNA glycosylase family 4